MQPQNLTDTIEATPRRPRLVLAYSRDRQLAGDPFSISPPLSTRSHRLSPINGLAWLGFMLIGVGFYAAVTAVTLHIWS